jgi:Tetracyclin repressor-like, C-terminal domain
MADEVGFEQAHPGRYAASQMHLDAEVAVVSAGPRHSQMMRAMLRGYGLTDLDQTHAVRLLGSFFHGYASLESAGAFSHSTPDSEDSWSRILEVLDSTLTNWRQG